MAEFIIYVEKQSYVPDFRLFGVFLWGDGHNVDSEGDSFNPASRTWTDLYMKSRENINEYFTIFERENNPGIYEIRSTNNFITNRIAYFLSKETSQYIFINEKKHHYDYLEDKLGDDFDLLSAVERSDRSIWRSSTLENPYPNMK